MFTLTAIRLWMTRGIRHLLSGSLLFAGSLSAQTPQRPRITRISHFATDAHDYD